MFNLVLPSWSVRLWPQSLESKRLLFIYFFALLHIWLELSGLVVRCKVLRRVVGSIKIVHKDEKPPQRHTINLSLTNEKLEAIVGMHNLDC